MRINWEKYKYKPAVKAERSPFYQFKKGGRRERKKYQARGDEDFIYPLEVTPAEIPVIAFDTEDDGAGHVDIINFYDGKFHYTFTRPLKISESELQRFFEDVHRFIYEYSERRVYFIAHNLEYDIVNLCRDLDYRYIENLMYTMRLLNGKLVDHKGEFLDSMNFFPASLRVMAETIGMKKGEYTEARKNLTQYIKYCRMDTSILWTWVTRFQRRINEEMKVNLGVTIGKMSMDVYRANYLKKPVKKWNDPINRLGYYGGRVEIFYKGEIRGAIRYDDVNSMYPSVMMQRFPDTATMKRGAGLDSEFGIGKFTIRVPDRLFIPPLPYKCTPDGLPVENPIEKNKRLYFPVGDLTGVWTFAEVRNAINAGCEIISTGETWGTNQGEYYFREFIEDIYRRRLTAKADADEFGILFYKLFMNNLYGKWSAKGLKTVLMQEFLDEGKLRKKDLEYKRALGPFHVYRSIERIEDAPKTANWLWGTYVTSLARVKHWNIMHALHEAGHRLLYCDTDSVIYEVKKGAAIPHKISKDIGDLSAEEYIKGDFRNPKSYLLENAEGKIKIVSKGVPRDYAHKFFESGYAEYLKPNKLRQSFISGIVGNFWDTSAKHLQTVYVKRKTKAAAGVTYPVRVEKIARQEMALKEFRKNGLENFLYNDDEIF